MTPEEDKNYEHLYKKQVKLSILFSIILIGLLIFVIYKFIGIRNIHASNEVMIISDNEPYRQEVVKDYCSLETVNCDEEQEVELERSYREVLFTNYYTNDNQGSTNVTASGLTTHDFTPDEYGFMTYQGKVVLATANTSRWNRHLYQGYRSHELYEVIDFNLNGIDRQGIVLDVCGACHGVSHETKQRYDIMTTHSVIGKQIGKVY